jgi:hypothetical protein
LRLTALNQLGYGPPPKPRERYISTKETVERLRAALKRRSRRSWSVTQGKGTAGSWIRVDVSPKRRTWEEGIDMGKPEHWRSMSPADRDELVALFQVDAVTGVGFRGISPTMTATNFCDCSRLTPITRHRASRGGRR